jgi:hypothetical protein
MDLWQSCMDRAREETGYRGPDVAHTPKGIGEALRQDRRAEFYEAVANADSGFAFEGVLHLWWQQAVIDAAPQDPAAEDFISMCFAHYADERPAEPAQLTHEEFMAELEHAE